VKKQDDNGKKEGGEEKKGDVEKEGGENKAEKEKKGEGDNGGKKKEVILKVDLHCEGCGMKVKKSIRTVQGSIIVSVCRKLFLFWCP
jgi:hypothetical protein